MVDKIEHTDPLTHRIYEALQHGEDIMIIGPPEGLVDMLGLPEPFATNLHNILYRRRIFTYAQASRGNVLHGALQEALNIDAQRLTEAFKNYETEEVVP